jgi:uncharacterized membrane protein YdjX (TVP38/TMEM64 family)
MRFDHYLWKVAAAVVAVAVVVAVFKYLPVQPLLRGALDWIEGLGIWAPFMFVLIYIVATVLFVPASVLTLGAGVLFGVIQGSIIVSIASTLGATAAFLVGRYLARDWVAGKIQGRPRFKAIDHAVAREGWKIVGLTRLSPVFPFNLLNYAFGLTQVTVKGYFFATWIGMIPGTIMYVYVGSLIGDLAMIGAGERQRTWQEQGFFILGLAATVAVTLYVTRVAKRALNQKVETDLSSPSSVTPEPNR